MSTSAPVSEVVETVSADSMAELRARRDRATAPIVELRLDGVRDLDVAGALDGRRTRVLVACHPSWEGGRFDGNEDERIRILSEASRLGAEFVDVEWKADRRAFTAAAGTSVVLSWHDFDGLPADLATGIRRHAPRAAGDRQGRRDGPDARRLSDASRRVRR